MAARSIPKVSLIGSGKVGSSLARALFEKGYPIVSIINRTGPPAIRLAGAVKCKRVSTHIDNIHASTDIIIIAVTDDSLQNVADELSKTKRLSLKNILVAHTSGAHASSVLSALRRKGALTASMHPIQSFPEGRKQAKLRGIFFGVEGAPEALIQVERLVQDVGARMVTIPPELKPLYHIACVFASSYMVALLNAIGEMAALLNIRASWTEVFGPLMTAATENTIKTSAWNALTGPIIRRDSTTISLHLKTLAAIAPQFLPLYCVAGIEVARVATEHGKMTKAEYQDIVSLFRQFLKSYPDSKKSKP
ncbi:MAG TPA: Rossmann-like and DUF2520 domain-containing protein [Bacteroidota bacterium]|jgi:predicted short-subunit dehydrogenase-like oxidoreductase (DUF2520 family)|nr:Rossmann-like and DUF2520 domain-containing protein [Bacteroidota bacterium]